MKIYTIGFTQKNAEDFFERIKQHGVKRLIDIRIHPNGQLSGFAKQEDLPYFLKELADDCGYAYIPDLAPTKEILKEYRDGDDWERYVTRFEALMDERNIPQALNPDDFNESCLLCSEATPEQCHRRLVAERFAKHWQDVEIIHL
ncbi:MAG: DUF488 domain-containing protein [Chloroflexi bacterium]|nr:DUF488 domain-containing protein [Chloroflexota bacterium]